MKLSKQDELEFCKKQLKDIENIKAVINRRLFQISASHIYKSFHQVFESVKNQKTPIVGFCIRHRVDYTNSDIISNYSLAADTKNKKYLVINKTLRNYFWDVYKWDYSNNSYLESNKLDLFFQEDDSFPSEEMEEMKDSIAYDAANSFEVLVDKIDDLNHDFGTDIIDQLIQIKKSVIFYLDGRVEVFDEDSFEPLHISSV